MPRLNTSSKKRVAGIGEVRHSRVDCNGILPARLPGAYWHNSYGLGESTDKAVTWFPVLEPIVVVLLLLLAAGSVAFFIRALVVGERLLRTSPH
jgi:hypothetical protein